MSRMSLTKPTAWVWPTLLAASVISVGFIVFEGLAPALRPWLVFWFVLVCPGMAFVRLLHIPRPLAEWTLAIALSLALATGVAGLLLYRGTWSPSTTLLILMGVSLVGALLQVVQSRRE